MKLLKNEYKKFLICKRLDQFLTKKDSLVDRVDLVSLN